MYYINDNYVKIRKVNNKYVGVHLFSGKILYERGVFASKNLNQMTIKRLETTLDYLEKRGV